MFPPGVDMGAMLNNPAMMNMANTLMNDPNIQNMMGQLMGAGGGGLNNIFAVRPESAWLYCKDEFAGGSAACSATGTGAA